MSCSTTLTPKLVFTDQTSLIRDDTELHLWHVGAQGCGALPPRHLLGHHRACGHDASHAATADEPVDAAMFHTDGWSFLPKCAWLKTRQGMCTPGMLEVDIIDGEVGNCVPYVPSATVQRACFGPRLPRPLRLHPHSRSPTRRWWSGGTSVPVTCLMKCLNQEVLWGVKSGYHVSARRTCGLLWTCREWLDKFMNPKIHFQSLRT